MTQEQDQLREWFLENAVVTDIKKGYIVVAELNIVLDTELLGLITNAWIQLFQNLEIDAIVGLPDAAGRLVSPLALALNIPTILPAKKHSYPKGWEGLGEVVEYEAESFTGPTQEVMSAFIGGVIAGMRVLVIDDVVATGEVGASAILALQQAGVIVVGLGVIFDKVWQGGVEKIEHETGVPVSSLVSVDEITPEGKIKLRDGKQ